MLNEVLRLIKGDLTNVTKDREGKEEQDETEKRVEIKLEYFISFLNEIKNFSNNNILFFPFNSLFLLLNVTINIIMEGVMSILQKYLHRSQLRWWWYSQEIED